MGKKDERSHVSKTFVKVLMEIISNIPSSSEPHSSAPHTRAQSIAKKAARKCAGIAGALAIPLGPWGLATILPDLIYIWKIQSQMVADIASTYGKTAILNRQVMLYCLFKHGSAALFRDVIARVGERLLVRRVTLRTIQRILRKISVRLTQRVIGRAISRWLPAIGSLAIAAYAYYDTSRVAATAIETFKKEIEIEGK